MKAVDELRAAGATVVFDETILPDSFSDAVRAVRTQSYRKEGTEAFLRGFGPAEYHTADEYQKATGSALPATLIGGAFATPMSLAGAPNAQPPHPEVAQTLLEGDAAGVTQNLKGKALDTTPRFAATLAYDHEWTLSGGGTLRAGLQTKYSSSYEETDVQNAVQYKQRQFTRSNADIRFTDATGKFYVGAFVQNIENKLQINANPSGFVNAPGFVPQPGPNGSTVPDAATVTVTDPRTWGFMTGVKFH